MDIKTNQNCSLNGYLNCSLTDQQSKYFISPTFILLSIAGIFIFVFNCGVFILFIKEKNLRGNPYYFLVLMLSVSDFTVGVGITCISARQIIPYLRDNNFITVLQIVLMTTGVYLSLLQTFLISLQRYLIICKENVHSFFFSQKRKYLVCLGCWIPVVIMNCFLVSPPSRKFNPNTDHLLKFVYSGRYVAHTIYSRFLSMFLLFSTVILYFVTIRYIKLQSMKVHPIGTSNTVHLKTINVKKDQQSTSTATLDAKEKTSTLSSYKSNVKATTSKAQNHLVLIRHKKVMSTLYFVGLLIIVLLIFTGPLLVALWVDNCSPKVMGIVFCLNIINAVANPFLYMWKLVEFRKYLKSVIRCVPSASQD